MIFALVLLLACFLAVWLVFFRFRWLKFNIGWAIVVAFFVLHVLLIFLIGIRFVTPYSDDAVVVQHTIQIVPRLTQPSRVQSVLVEPGVPVKKGQPLFVFDPQVYQDGVNQLEAQLAEAKQNVLVLKSDVEVANATVQRGKVAIVYDNVQLKIAKNLAVTGAGKEIEVESWTTELEEDQAALVESEAELARAKLKYESQINGVNTTVASTQAALDLQKYYLANTTLVAPEDGRMVNVQVRPGMVAGDYRMGSIASFVCDQGRYLLASFSQESLKYVTNGMPVEIALNLYPGQIFRGRVDSIWRVNGDGQYLPSGNLPKFEPRPPEMPQNCYPVVIVFDDPDQSKFTIGAQGAAAIYTNGMHGPWAVLRRIGIRTHSWFNWLYPMPF